MFDVAIAGAGAAGLTAARRLAERGKSVVVLEARNRVGGRMWSEPVPGLELPAELGAEFVHGTPEVLWQLLNEWRIPVHERKGRRLCAEGGQLLPCDFNDSVDQIFSALEEYTGPDLPFEEWLHRHGPPVPERARERARQYIEGFDGADSSQISVAWLRQAGEAEEEDGGGRLFTVFSGYSSLIGKMQSCLPSDRVTLRLACPVRRITASAHGVELHADGMVERARCAIVTVPAPVLSSIEFSPAIPNLNAASRIAMGAVMRVSFAFENRLWPEFSMLHSDETVFPTWWTHSPSQTPLLTAWTGGPRAGELSRASREEIISLALQTLSRLIGVSLQRIHSSLLSAHTHNWQTDEWARGAYSYVSAGNFEATELLARPAADRIFFAGEATETTGRSGLVHGAILTGERAAREALRSL